jgi:ATP-binding cassette subfamily C protein
VGGAVVILFLAAEFFLPLRSLASYFHVAMGGAAAADKIFALLQTPHPVRLHGGLRTHSSQRHAGLKLEQVSFSYTGRQQTLQGVNMEVQAGRTTALVGPSGCGKSTVAALLVHFIEPDTGRVLLNGRDLKNIPVDELRSVVCLIPQNTYIFTGTVADNLKMARPDASEAQMLEACAAAGLLDFVQSSPGGLRTEVGEAGARLSGGQKQKLGIARALLLDAGLYIFDEATSNVDVESEEEIWQAIWNITGEKTVLIISHRLSTVVGADRIYVMDQGRIQAWGRHEQLMAQGGLYYRLAVEQGELVKGKVVFHEKRSGCL